MKIKKIGVVGIGLMGKGIVHSFAKAGYDIVAVTRRSRDCSLVDYLKNVYKSQEDGSTNVQTLLNKIKITNSIYDLKECHLVIETIPEKIELKIKLWKKIDKICGGSTIFASNTSTINISKLSDVCPSRKHKFIGLHFMSPVEKMNLVEIIKSNESDAETLSKASEIIYSLSKTPIIVKDYPGFVTSRLLATYVNEAAKIMEEGISSFEDIDLIVKLGLNHPVGPFRLADEVGLDVVINVLDNLYNSFNDEKYKASRVIRQLFNDGKLGRKTGSGFYNYKN